MPQILKAILTRLGFRTSPGDATGERDSLNYFKLGSQYYLAARAATFAGCLPVAGNLFHHAVEMYLKGDLCKRLPRARLKMLGHRLQRLWAGYKAEHRSVDLSKHDLTIKHLDKFERIRYPDAMTDRGMFATISVSRPNPPPSMWAASGYTPPSYHLVVNDIDELVRDIFDTTSQNPVFFFGRFSSEWKAIVQRDNPSFPVV